MKTKPAIQLGAKKIALVAVMTATIEGVKLALTALPNVEAVTLLCAAYGYIFGPLGLLATSLFVVIETFIYPIHTWVIYYMIHWNAVCFVFWMLHKLNVKNRFLLTHVAVLQTAFFGVETSFIDTLILTGLNGEFWARFAALYVRGITFYIVQVVCNVILFPIVFIPFTNFLQKTKEKFFIVPKKEKKLLPSTDENGKNIPLENVDSEEK